jgi:hypothetical protein
MKVNKTEKKEFIYVGDPDKNKDKIGLIVKCFSQLSENHDFLFTVIGITEKQFRTNFPSYVDCLERLKGKIEFQGRISHAKSVLALKRANCCIFIRDKSRKNMAGFPTKFVECATSGIHIIASDISDIKTYSDKVVCEWIIENDEIDIKNAICHMIEKNSNYVHNGTDVFDYRNYIVPMKSLLGSINE